MARHLFQRCCGESPRCAVYMVADDPRRTHEMRRRLHAKRYPKLSDAEAAARTQAGFTVIDGRAFKPDETPLDASELSAIDSSNVRAELPWHRLMQSARGKAVAMACLVSGLKHIAQSTEHSDTFKLFVWYDSEPYLFPRVWPRSIVADVCDNGYGEADQRVMECVRAIQQRRPDAAVWIHTIDTDMLLQSLVAPFALKDL